MNHILLKKVDDYRILEECDKNSKLTMSFFLKYSGNPLIYTNWWVDHGTLNSTCVQLLKNGKTSPKKLDSFYWTMAAGRFNTKDCSDGDNGIICERTPDMNHIHNL